MLFHRGITLFTAPIEASCMRKIQALLLCVTACVGVSAVVARTSDETAYALNGPAIVSGPEDIRAGKLVQSPGGQVIGTVKDVVHGPSRGAFSYALVATDSGTAAIPCWAINHLLKDGHIVIDSELLASAPRVQDAQVRDDANNDWKTEADRYWRGWQ